jgi:hypothetical protein
MKITIFWDIMPCGPLKVNRRFGGTSAPSQGSNKMSVSILLVICFHAGISLGLYDSEDVGDMSLRNIR